MKLLTLILLYFSCLNLGFAQLVDLSNWKLDSLPQGKRLIEANNSKDNWMFQKDGIKYSIIQNEYERDLGDDFPFPNALKFQHILIPVGNGKIKKVDEGYIVGTNNGEFTSGLYFVNKNASKKHILNSYFRVNDIYEFHSKIYAIQGLAHLSISEGSIIEIYKDSLWTYREVLKLEDAPKLVLKTDSGNIILTSQHLYKQTAEKVEKVLRSPFYWGMLYPSSMVLEDIDL